MRSNIHADGGVPRLDDGRTTTDVRALARRRDASARASTDGPRFYSVSQVARLLGMSAMTIYRAIEAGEFPAVRIRSRLIIPARAIEEMADTAVGACTVVDSASWVRTDGVA